MLFEARLNGWLNDGKLLLRLVTADLERLDGWGGVGQTVNDTSDFLAGPGYALLFEARLNGWLNDGKLLMRLVTADLERLDGCGRHWSNGE